MNFIFLRFNEDEYEVYVRGSTIVRITHHDGICRESREVPYDELDYPTREAILIAVIEGLAKNA